MGIKRATRYFSIVISHTRYYTILSYRCIVVLPRGNYSVRLFVSQISAKICRANKNSVIERQRGDKNEFTRGALTRESEPRRKRTALKRFSKVCLDVSRLCVLCFCA